MRRLTIAALLGLALILPTAVSAAKAPATGSIALITADPSYGDDIYFASTVVGKYPGYLEPRIVVRCYQSGDLVFGWLDRPEARFWLAGLDNGISQWDLNGGGPADCTATLYLYAVGLGKHNDVIPLDSTAFHAAG